MPRVLATLCLSLTCVLAQATEVRWTCSLSADLVRLRCVGDVAPIDATRRADVRSVPSDVIEARAMSAADSVEVRGTRFPLDPRQTWTVDLFSVPDDGAFVEQLARATICYRSPRCRVHVDLRPLQPGVGSPRVP